MVSLFSEALDFALPKAGKDSDFKLKTEQKLIIEAVVDFFTPFAIGSITSRCSGKEPALLPRTHGWTRELGIVNFDQ